jgi:hypothetical protein
MIQNRACGLTTHSVTSGAADKSGTSRSLASKLLTSAIASDTTTSKMTSTGMSFEDWPVCESSACWSAKTCTQTISNNNTNFRGQSDKLIAMKMA